MVIGFVRPAKKEANDEESEMRIRRRLRILWNYYLGEWFCARFHRPLLASLGGCGGRNHWRRRRKEYYSRTCLICERRWEKSGSPKKLTREQEDACEEALGDSWRRREPAEKLADDIQEWYSKQ